MLRRSARRDSRHDAECRRRDRSAGGRTPCNDGGRAGTDCRDPRGAGRPTDVRCATASPDRARGRVDPFRPGSRRGAASASSGRRVIYASARSIQGLGVTAVTTGAGLPPRGRSLPSSRRWRRQHPARRDSIGVAVDAASGRDATSTRRGEDHAGRRRGIRRRRAARRVLRPDEGPAAGTEVAEARSGRDRCAGAEACADELGPRSTPAHELAARPTSSGGAAGERVRSALTQRCVALGGERRPVSRDRRRRRAPRA